MTLVPEPKNVLVVQTAFLGDLILTLPLVQSLKSLFPAASIDLLVVPKTAGVLGNHPAIGNVWIFDKRGLDSGMSGFMRQARKLRRLGYDLAFLPHRSLRSASLARIAGIPRRIGFDSSAARFLLTDVIPYDSRAHEIDRNLNLLEALAIRPPRPQYPELFPSAADREAVDRILSSHALSDAGRLIGIAPGTVWNTKRWPPERFAALAETLLDSGFEVAILGGKEDGGLLTPFLSHESRSRVLQAAGELTILQSAELIRRCRVLVCNDSAPMHLAGAVRTRVVALFGATIPGFGFGPVGPRDVVIETSGLTCRPCSIHGGDVCPVKTFACMLEITPSQIFEAVKRVQGS